MSRPARLILRAVAGLAALLALVAPFSARAQQQITSWQGLAVYVGQQTTKINELNARIKALEASQATLAADMDMQAEALNRLIRYGLVHLCAANARITSIQVLMPWVTPYPIGAHACPVGEYAVPAYIRSSTGRVYGIETLP